MEFSTRPMARAAVAASLLIGVAAIVLNWQALIAPLRLDPETGALEQIFGVRPVLAAIRIGTVILISYIAGSVLGLGLEGRLLVKAGPAGAEAEPAGALGEVAVSHRELVDRVHELEESIEGTWNAIRELEEADWEDEED